MEEENENEQLMTLFEEMLTEYIFPELDINNFVTIEITPLGYSDVLLDIINLQLPDKSLDIQFQTYDCISKEEQIHKDTCAICLEKFKSDDIVSDITCNHIFHKDCIEQWGKTKQNCPLCKVDLPYTYSYSF